MDSKLQNLSNILFIDIETVSEYKNYQELPENLQPFWNKKASSQKEFDGSNEGELYGKRAAIFSEFGKIIKIKEDETIPNYLQAQWVRFWYQLWGTWEC